MKKELKDLTVNQIYTLVKTIIFSARQCRWTTGRKTSREEKKGRTKDPGEGYLIL